MISHLIKFNFGKLQVEEVRESLRRQYQNYQVHGVVIGIGGSSGYDDHWAGIVGNEKNGCWTLQVYYRNQNFLPSRQRIGELDQWVRKVVTLTSARTK